MPQQPSGRHIAISAEPLSRLLGKALDVENIPLVMGLVSVEALHKYFDVLFLVPENEAPPDATAPDLRKDSLTPPPGLVIVDSGFRLSERDALTATWTEEDRTAFREFLDGRAKPLFDLAWAEVTEKKKLILAGDKPLARILGAWYMAGVHPAQEDGWAESDVGGTDWDDYDLLAALGQVRQLLPEHPEYLERWQTQARVDGVWQAFVAECPELAGWPDPRRLVRECGEEARADGWLESLEPTRRQWIHDQAVIELIELWNVLGEGFRAAMPQPYGIVELVVCSAEANRFFETKEPRN